MSLSRVQLFATPWTVAHQAPPSMEFSRQEYWRGLPFSSPGDLPTPGIKPRSTCTADKLRLRLSEPLGNPVKAKVANIWCMSFQYFSINIFVVVQSLNCVQLFVTPRTAAHQAPLSSTSSWSLLRFMSVELMMLTISSCAAPFSFSLQSFPAAGSFQMNGFFASGGQITRA